MCPCDTWTMENVTHGKMNSRVRGSFLSLEGNKKNKIRWVRGERKERRKNENKKAEKEKKKKEKDKEKER